MKRSISAVLFAVTVILSLSLSSCSKKDGVSNLPVKTYVIVPGAWQGPYAWQTVKSQLEGQGQKVIVVELPGHGSDQTDPKTLTLNTYRDKVVSTINGVSGKVILVGHSLGGLVVAEVAEAIPSKIEKLVYIAAFLPVSGQSLLSLANTDAKSLIGPALRPSADGSVVDVEHDLITNIFIQDGSAAIQSLVLTNYRAEPAVPLANTVTLTSANYGSVPKYYIQTSMDHVVSPDLQTRMITAAGVTNLYTLNTSHCPFLSQPDAVTALLVTIGK